MFSWKTTATILALSFFGVGSLVYFLFKHDEKDDNACFVKTSKNAVIEVKIPYDSIGIVIGRSGNTIREIESMSDTKVQIRDDVESEEFKICYIKGTPEGVQYAESLIHEVIVSQPLIETYEMFVPNKACGRIIGKNGDNIRLICRSSNAKIIVENTVLTHQMLERKIIIKGTAEQIAMAKKLVEEKIEEELEFRNDIETHVSNRPPRNKIKYLLPAKGESTETDNRGRQEKFMATGSNGLLEVYVSAIESPDRLWVQVMGPRTVELDRLNEQMTEYYSKEENQKLHVLKEVKSGQIVATPFTFDDKWYRAEVLEVINNSDSKDPDVQLYYVDYGDTSLHKRSKLFELRTDFLRLRFQAIECMLAKVKPRNSVWPEEAIDLLEDLTHVALWKSLTAKIHSYKDRPTRIKREGSPIPCVELYDNHGEKTVNVAEELVEKGFAVWEEETETLKESSNPDEEQQQQKQQPQERQEQQLQQQPLQQRHQQQNGEEGNEKPS